VDGRQALYAAWAALLLTGTYPLWRAWRANRATTLRQAVVWAGLAWAAWVLSAATRAAFPNEDAGLWRYLPPCVTGCAAVAVLGARRPGVRAWNFVVLGLLAVLLRPVFQGLGELREIDLASLIVLATALAVGLINYLPTPLAAAAVPAAAVCAAEVAGLLGAFGGSWQPVEVAALALLAAAPWAGLAALRRRGGGTDFDRSWRDFRDRYGLVWGLRVCDQFNRAARHAGWPASLRWGGLRTPPGAAPDLKGPTAGLHALLKRFGPEEAQ
jgi:hypothetical protein